jgi:hypothetical protein
MIPYTKRLQMLFHEYERQLGKPGTPRDAVMWGLRNGKLAEPKPDPVAILVADLKDALRTETRKDVNGIEYRANAAVTYTSSGGIQESLWGDIDRASTPHDFVTEHIGQRRKGIVDDCSKLKADVDHYNGAHPERPRIQLILDFTDDVAEREIMKGDTAA